MPVRNFEFTAYSSLLTRRELVFGTVHGQLALVNRDHGSLSLAQSHHNEIDIFERKQDSQESLAFLYTFAHLTCSLPSTIRLEFLQLRVLTALPCPIFWPFSSQQELPRIKLLRSGNETPQPHKDLAYSFHRKHTYSLPCRPYCTMHPVCDTHQGSAGCHCGFDNWSVTLVHNYRLHRHRPMI